MEELLRQIEDAYVASVPEALSRVAIGEKLVGAFIPYFAWEAMPEDHAEHGQQIYLLGESYFTNIGDDPEEKTFAFSWPRICEEKSVSIGSDVLQKFLLEWYTYQNDNDSTIGENILLAQIGNAVTSACRRLNAIKWPSDKFADDFVVFSQCMSDDSTDFGISASVTPEWLARMRAQGLF